MHINRTHKLILSFLSGFIIGALVIFIWSSYTQKTKTNIPTTTTTPNNLSTDTYKKDESSTSTETAIINTSIHNVQESPHITVRAQDAGNDVVIDEVTLPFNGWIVIHEGQGGYIGNALGVIRKDAGTYTNIKVSLLRNTKPTTQYWVVLYSDNGDHEFNLRDDFPIRDSDSNPIISSFTTN